MKLYFFLTLYLFLLAGCSSTNKWQKEFLPQYQSGNIQSAVSHLEHIKLKEVPKNNFTLCKNSVWIYLNLATMQFAKGNIKEAIKNYDIALDSMDYYRQRCTIEQYGQFLIDDNQSAYLHAA
jgi:hypothetical protein